MRPIFVSYRREDAEGEAGRLFDDLVGRFGENSVFLDVAAIEIGRDFRKAIDDSVSTCGVLLAIIGKGWIDARDEAGGRRLDDPSDFVRLETASALRRDIPVIPVLVHGAKMPRAEQLPEDLKELAYRNGVELTHARWRSDLELLIKALSPHVDHKPVTPPQAAIPPQKPEETGRSSGRWWNSRRVILASVVGVLVLGAMYWLRPTHRTVPDLIGSSLSDATLKLQAAGLAVGSKAYQPDPEKGASTVLSQAPLPNARVNNGTAVDLVLVQPTSLVEVPPLTGRTLVEAQATLQGLHLAVGQVSQEPNASVAPNTVVFEFPAPGKKVDPGTAVDLVVAQMQTPAQGPTPPKVQVEVPALRGRLLGDAQVTLRDLHLTVGKISRQPNSNVAPNTVLFEFPDSGKKVDPGTAIDLVVAQMQGPAQGPSPPIGPLKVKVPNFAGTWELFAITVNGVSEAVNVKSKRLVVTQNGTTVNIFGRELEITPAGTVGYQMFAAHDDKSGHEVATAAQADLVDTLTCRIEGSNLVYETVFDYRHQYFNHPPGREVRVMSYRRVAP